MYNKAEFKNSSRIYWFEVTSYNLGFLLRIADCGLRIVGIAALYQF